MFTYDPFQESIDDLIAVAYMSKARRSKIVKKIRNLPPDTPIDKIIKLIEIFSDDPDSAEFSELGVSLAYFLEKLEKEKVEELIQKLIELEHGYELLGIMLNISTVEIDRDLLFEILRKMLLHERDEVRNAAISIIKNRFDDLTANIVEDLLLDMAESDENKIRMDAILLMTILSNKLRREIIDSILTKIIMDCSPEVLAQVKDNLESFKSKLGKKRLKELEELIKSCS